MNFCYFFGSYAKGKTTSTSDVAFLISANAKGLRFYGLVEAIRTALHKKVEYLSIAAFICAFVEIFIFICSL